MRRMKVHGAVFAVAAMLTAAPAMAQEVRGSGFLDAVDPVSGVVVIGGAKYSVRSSSVIADENGRALPLEELPSLASGASNDEAAVWYEAGEASTSSPRPLLRLNLTGGAPE